MESLPMLAAGAQHSSWCSHPITQIMEQTQLKNNLVRENMLIDNWISTLSLGGFFPYPSKICASKVVVQARDKQPWEIPAWERISFKEIPMGLWLKDWARDR